MPSSLNTKLYVGVVIWLGLIVAGVFLSRRSSQISPRAAEQLINYVSSQRSTIDIVTKDHVVIGIGDSLFATIDGKLEPVGVVTALDYDAAPQDQPVRLAWVTRATVTFFSDRPLIDQGSYVDYYMTDQSPAWVVKTMLSPAIRSKISNLIGDAYDRNQADLVEKFRPVIQKMITDSSLLIQQSVIQELTARQDEVSALAQRYQRDVLEKEILPVLQVEVWPIVEEETAPLVEEIGQEIWGEVSVWRFGWRFLYDKSPLPNRNLAKKEFDRFVKKKALPIFESHFDEIVEIQKRLMKRIVANKKVTGKISSAASRFFSDDEVKILFTDVFKKSVLNNMELKQSIEQTWRSDEAKRAMRMANNRLESTITEIGQTLFGSPTGSVPQEFARVLRNRVLHKDDRWLVLKLDNNVATATLDTSSAQQILTEIPLSIAADDAPFPIGNKEDKDQRVLGAIEK